MGPMGIGICQDRGATRSEFCTDVDLDLFFRGLGDYGTMCKRPSLCKGGTRTLSDRLIYCGSINDGFGLTAHFIRDPYSPP